MEKKNSSVIEPDLKLFSKEQLLAAALGLAHDEQLPVAVWRMPHQSEINLLISFSEATQLDRYELQELKNGFAFAPFNFNRQKGYFINGDVLLSFDFGEIVLKSPNQDFGENAEVTEFKRKLVDRIEYEKTSEFINQHKTLKSTDSCDYKQLVEKSIEAINDGFFEKVVPARSIDISLPQHFDLLKLFGDLCNAYQNAFISFVSIPEVGSWLGATPEILIEREANIFRTHALAATQRYNPENDLSETLWTQKEIEEQAMVSRYIISCFKRIRLREFSEKGPQTVKAGNLLHLKTSFEVDLMATNFPELPTVMLELLHPTSAVAGMPKDQAISFLKLEEHLDRSFYSGFLGPVNIEDRTSLFVNLRCMELAGNKARLFAGAGVTAHSNPDKEFAETEMKFNTLLNILNQDN
ncbi:MAG: isochorismate synthase [Cytophagia bacterium]|nr:isochorismate synthase [Cytophagia bacterium]